MASKQQIIEAANDSARQLGYEKLKDLQLEIAYIGGGTCLKVGGPRKIVACTNEGRQ